MRSSLALVLIGLIWALCWAVLGLSALPGSTIARGALVLVFAALFGAGETLMAPTMRPDTSRMGAEAQRMRSSFSSRSNEYPPAW